MRVMDELGITHCPTCAGITPAPPRPDWDGTVVKCECRLLRSTVEVVSA